MPPAAESADGNLHAVLGSPMADFGLQGLPGDAPGDDHLSRYRNVLDLLPPEFTTVWIQDHLQKGEQPLPEGWTFLTYLAALYPRFRFGHLVLSQSFRNPALLAKMAASRLLYTSQASRRLRIAWTATPHQHADRPESSWEQWTMIRVGSVEERANLV